MVRRRGRTASKNLGKLNDLTNEHNRNAGQESSKMFYNNSNVAMASTSNLLDDQYFASPKRKDCKITNTSEKQLKINDLIKLKCKAKNSHKSTDKNISELKIEYGDRNIGLQAPIRSQTHTIDKFFKANVMAYNHNICNEVVSEQNTILFSTSATPSPTTTIQTDSISVSSSPATVVDDDNNNLDELYDVYHEPTPSPPKYTLNGEDTNDDDLNISNAIKYDDKDVHTLNPFKGIGTFSYYKMHRSSLRDSYSSTHSNSSSNGSGIGTVTDNIFLQKPVLKLDIDKSLNQASSIKINKSFEVGHIFSSPPTSASACILNGHFDKIVTLNNTSPVKRNSLGIECNTQQQQTFVTVAEFPKHNGFIMEEQDGSSCDSGVDTATASSFTSVATTSLNSQSRRRKPATPHRILCASPIKTLPQRETLFIASPPLPGARKLGGSPKEQLSPRKSPRHTVNISTSKAAVTAAATTTTTGLKSRRRLNQPCKHNAPAKTMQQQQELNVSKTIVYDNGECKKKDVLQVVFKAELENMPTQSSSKSKQRNAAKQNTIARSQTNNSKLQTNKTNLRGAKSKITSSNSSNSSKSKTQPLASNRGNNHELTEYFPVRRSVRKTKSAVLEEMMRNLERTILEECEDGLKIAYFEGKGRGVVAQRRFQRGEFVVEYIGDLITISEAGEREKRYILDENAGCYMYYFKHNNQQYCIDATADTGKLGRLVNHSRNGNLVTKIMVIKGRPRLILFAKDDIEPGEELCYDYGDRTKEALLHHPWLAF